MSLQGEGKLLRITIGEADRWHRKPLYHEIVEAAHQAGMASVTVLRGIEGFGAGSRIRTTRVLSLAEDLPLVIEVVDTAERIEVFLEQVDPMITEGMVTIERVEVRAYRSNEDSGS